MNWLTYSAAWQSAQAARSRARASFMEMSVHPPSKDLHSLVVWMMLLSSTQATYSSSSMAASGAPQLVQRCLPSAAASARVRAGALRMLPHLDRV